MANTKSAIKRATRAVARQQINLSRKSAIKTAIKKVVVALEQGEAPEVTTALLRDAEAKLARAKNKGTLHANTVARKISGIARKVAAAQRAA